jgi:hypothetical protein
VAKSAVARCAVAGIRDVAVDIIGAHPRDVVVPLRGAQSGREAKRSVRRRGGIYASRTVRSAAGCQWVDVPPDRRVRGSVARCAIAHRIRDVAIDIVGTLPRDAVVPLRGAPSGREAERRSVRRRGGIPASRTVRSAQGCPRADVPPGQKAKGSVARCAVARIRDVAVDVVGTHPRDVVVPRCDAPVGRKAEGSVRSRGGAETVCQEASWVRHRVQVVRIGRGAEISVRRGIDVGGRNGIVGGRQRRKRVEEGDIVVVVVRRASGGVVLFAPRVNIVVVRIGEGWDWNWIERDGGVERPTNTLSKSGTDARLSTVILLANYPVVRRDRVGASSAIPWFAASARPSGLGAGAAARGAGSEWRAEAAEVLRAAIVFCRLSCLLPEGVAVDADGDRLTPSVRLAKMVCSWWRLAASATGPGAPGGGSRSWSKSVDVVVDSSESTWESVPPTRSDMSKKNPKMTMVRSKFKR